MWQEARKNEKYVRKLLVDYRKRSARRQDFYEKIKQDPTKFLQVHGRKSKIHLDGTVAAAAATNNHMMPWQGSNDNLIDRFDVRTHMDFIPEAQSQTQSKIKPSPEEAQCNFERYRVLIFNDHKKITEAQQLRQIYINEQFPEIYFKEKHENELKKQKLAMTKATIAFDYGGKNSGGSSVGEKASDDIESEESEDEEDIMEELEEIPPCSELSMDTLAALDSIGHKKYGLSNVGFSDGALKDQAIRDKADHAQAIESEKSRHSGRKGRRERRILKDERLRNREIGPLSYACQVYPPPKEESEKSTSSSDSSESEDDSKTKKNDGKIEFITSFDFSEQKDNTAAAESFNPEQKFEEKKSNKKNSKKHKHSSHKYEKSSRYSRSPRRRSRSHSSSERRRHHRSRRSRSRSYDRYRRRSSRERYRRSSSRERYSKRSRSSDRSSRYKRRSRSYSRSRSRSRSNSRGRRSNSRDRKSSSSHNATAVISSTKAALTPKASLNKTKSNVTKNLTPQEKLKIKMQRALNKQLKKDRATQIEKSRQAYEEQMAREDELREMARKMRKRRQEDEDDGERWNEYEDGR